MDIDDTEPMRDKDLIYNALICWANHIETGDVCMSAIDAQKSESHYNALDIRQMKMVIRLRELAKLVLEK